jgi:phage virion morphogenesis protein
MLDIEIDDREVRQALERLRRRVQDMSPVMRAIGADMERRMLERFETETDPAGRKWAPLAKRTLKAKKGRGSILYQHGTLMDSRSWQADASSVRWGFGQKYAAFHEFGTKKMPRRGLLFADAERRELAEEDRSLILEAIRAHLADG